MRAVSLDGALCGIERAGVAIRLPTAVARSLLDGDTRFLTGPLAQALDQHGFVEPGIEHREPDVDRNAVFAAALCGDDSTTSLAGLAQHQYVILGCGGIGSNTAVALAALGATRILVTDDDRIEAGNLNRLLWASPAEVGELKCEALARHLRNQFNIDCVSAAVRTSAETVRRVHESLAGSATWVIAVDDPTSAREAAGYLHGRPHTCYIHAGYVGARCVVGPMAFRDGDPCPFCSASRYRVDNRGYVAPSAAPNNLMITAMLAAQLLRAAGTEPAASALHQARWTLDLISGIAQTTPMTKSTECEVCSR
ncbi:ThiF family adenylyltransferase [Catellatospora coxensis]